MNVHGALELCMCGQFGTTVFTAVVAASVSR